MTCCNDSDHDNDWRGGALRFALSASSIIARLSPLDFGKIVMLRRLRKRVGAVVDRERVLAMLCSR